MIHETDGSKRINYNEFVSEFIKKIKQAIWLKYTLNQKNIKSIKKTTWFHVEYKISRVRMKVWVINR